MTTQTAELKIYKELSELDADYFFFVKPALRLISAKRLRLFSQNKSLRELNESIKEAKEKKDYQNFFLLLERREKIINSIKDSPEYKKIQEKWGEIREKEKKTENRIKDILELLGYKPISKKQIENQLGL